MKIRVEHGDFSENEMVLYCRELDEEMLEVLALLRERSNKLTAYWNDEIHVLTPNEVFYAEAVDGRVFLYTNEQVLETEKTLAALGEAHGELGFLRIGKSQMVNLYHVAKLKSLPNSRIEVTLKNGEKLIAARHYAQTLKEKLGILE